MTLIVDFLLVLLALGGLGLPWLRLLQRWPVTERLPLALAGALISGYLVLFGLYLGGISLRWFWLAPAAGVILSLARAPELQAVGKEPFVRATCLGWVVLSAWCLGWQSVVSSYSGAAWQGDWLEHYDRAHYFLARWPLDFRFLDYYLLPARPPLVNLWAAGFMGASGGGFFHYQVFMTLVATLVFVPLSTLVERWQGGSKGQVVLLVALMANPLFVQNATFPWTKLPAAFFVVLAYALLLPGADHRRPASERIVATCVVLAGGLLAHYSTAPWILAFGLAAAITVRCRTTLLDSPRGLAWGAFAFASLVLTWLGWSVHTFGVDTTLTGNTAVALAPDGTLGQRVGRAALNLWHTLSPYHHVGIGHPLLDQTSPWGRLRDGWFLGYQLKLPWAFGSAGLLCLCWLFWRKPGISPTRFGVITASSVIVLGTITHSIPDVLGLAHIALQPLVLLGLAWLAAHASHLPRILRYLWVPGLLLDLVMGILLHFTVQSLSLRRWLLGEPETSPAWDGYTLAAQTSYANKTVLNLRFLADELAPVLPGVLLASAVVVVMLWCRREMTFPRPSQTP